MADIYNIATQAFQQGRQRAQDQRLNELARLAMAKPSQFAQIAPQMAGVDAAAGLQLSGAIQERQLAEAERGRTRAIGLARYLRQIPVQSREQVATVYRSRAPDLPQTLDDNSLDAYLSMGQAQSMVGAPASLQEFNALTAGFSPEERASAARIRLGLSGRAPSAGMQWQKVQIGDTEYLVRTNPMTGEEQFATIGADGMPQIEAQGGGMSIAVPGGQIDVADPAAAEFLRANPDVMRGLSSGQPFDVAGAPAAAMGGAPGGVLAATNTVDLAARTAGAQERARIGAQLEAAPAQAAVAANLERVRELAKGEAGRENDRIANRNGMIVALNQADQSTAAMQELIDTSIAPMINNWTTGTFGSFLAGIGGTNAANLESNLDTLKAVAGFSELTALKARGGTLGAVSEMELQMLTSLWGALRNSQSPEAFRLNLNRYMNRVQQSWQNIADEYELRYGESAQNAVDRFRNPQGGTESPATTAGFRLIRATPIGGN